MNCNRFKLHLGLSVMLVFLITGCAAHRPKTDPALDRKAFALGVNAASLNKDVLSSRGSGWVLLETPEKTDKFKIAWAAVYPDNVRMTFLSSGIPVETIVQSKHRITFVSHTGQHARYSYYSEDPDMERFIKVPVKMSEIILILLGRVPIKNFEDAYFTTQDSMPSEITLKNINKNQTQYLKLNPKGNFEGLTVADSLGDELYKLTVKKYKIDDLRQIPAQIFITDTYHRKLTIDITDFKANPLLKENIFQLTEP